MFSRVPYEISVLLAVLRPTPALLPFSLKRLATLDQTHCLSGLLQVPPELSTDILFARGVFEYIKSQLKLVVANEIGKLPLMYMGCDF